MKPVILTEDNKKVRKTKALIELGENKSLGWGKGVNGLG